nr:hypothetical protein [Tanacetum cinerariifolium]
MTKDPSIPRRNKVNWHYVRYDQMFTTIKLVSRHQNTQQFSVILSIELTNDDIRNSAAYKEYYAIASGAAPPKTKASVRKTQISFDTTITPPTVAGTRLSTSAKGKQLAKSSKAKGLSMLFEIAMTEAKHMKLATKRSLKQTHISQTSGINSFFETTPQVDVQALTTVKPLTLTAPTLPSLTIPTISQVPQALVMDTIKREQNPSKTEQNRRQNERRRKVNSQ